MSEIFWDQTGEKKFEAGIDRGVFYSPHHLVSDFNGEGASDQIYYGGFPWNGLISVDDSPENLKTTPIYFDGRKTLDLVTPGDFSAKVKAFTYPDEFIVFDGFSEFVPGVFVDNQPRDTFGMSYRTLRGNDVDGSSLGYKIHILYNLTAVDDSVSYQTIGSNVDPIEFTWTITGIAESIVGRLPTAHVIFDSLLVDPNVLSMIENILYGTDTYNARQPTIDELIYYSGVVITDQGDGTWQAVGPDYFVSILEDGITFEIAGANAELIDANLYSISSTYE